MPSNNNLNERRLSKNLPVTSKCVAIVLSESDRNGAAESTEKFPISSRSVHNGKDLLEDFKLRNKTCYWNPALVESIKSLTYKGFVEPSTILVVGNEFHLENLRTAWGRRVLKAPFGFTIERIGDVNGIEMQVIPQTQFIPLPDALCLITMDLNNRCIVATLDTIKEKLLEWYKEMTMPNDQLIYDTLGCLIQERKVFHSGNGYFVVTPETYQVHIEDPNFSTSWLPYHPMYIPIFPQVQGLHHHHQQHFYKRHMHVPMCYITCQDDGQDKVKPFYDVCQTGKMPSDVKPRPRSLRIKDTKRLVDGKQKDKATICREDTLKQTVSDRYKIDNAESTKDIILKDINKDKEKGEKEKISLFSKIFGRNKKKNTPSALPIKDKEYASFSAQYPPPEWHWYKDQVEKQRQTGEWVRNQVTKSCTTQYLQNIVPSNSTVKTTVKKQDTALEILAKPTDSVLLNYNCSQEEKKRSGRRRGSKSNKTNHSGQRITKLHCTSSAGKPTEFQTPDEACQSVGQNRVFGPKHSTPCCYEMIPTEENNHLHTIEPVFYYSHRQKVSHRPRHGCNQSDISFEYKGMTPHRNSYHQSRESGVNFIGNVPNNKPQTRKLLHHPEPVFVRNKLDDLKGNQTLHNFQNHLKTTTVTDYQNELVSPTVCNKDNCCNFVIEHTDSVYIDCEGDNHLNPSKKKIKVSDPDPDFAEQGFGRAKITTRDCSAVLDVTDREDEFQAQKNTDVYFKLVDSGFCSPRNVDAKLIGKPRKKSELGLKSPSQIPDHSACEKLQEDFKNNLTVADCQEDSQKDGNSNATKGLDIFQQQQLEVKRFCVTGKYEMMGVV